MFIILCLFYFNTIFLLFLLIPFVSIYFQKCDQYWPKEIDKTCQYGNILIRLVDILDKCTYIQRKMEIVVIGQKRSIYHLQFKNWRDFRAPQNTEHLIKFIQDIHQLKPSLPIVVHCRSVSFAFDFSQSISN